MPPTSRASVVKLVDTPDSKSGALKSVSVRVRPLAPCSSDSQNHPYQAKLSLTVTTANPIVCKPKFRHCCQP